MLFIVLVRLLILFLLLFGFVRTKRNERTYEIPKSELITRSSALISVETKLGTVIGYKQEVRNRTISVFYGLPYAEPPTGKLRFKKTKQIKKFPLDPYPALSFKPHCRIKFSPTSFNPNDKFSEVITLIDFKRMFLIFPDL